MYNETLLLFLNTVVFLIFHNLKIRREADERLKKVVNAIFSALIFLYIVTIYGWPLWHSKPLMYIDILLIGLCLIVLIFQTKKNSVALKEIIRTVYKTNRSIVESLFLTVLLVVNYIEISSWLLSLLIFMGFLVKEMYLMSNIKKYYQ